MKRILIALSLLAAFACGGSEEASAPADAAAPAEAVAEVAPSSGTFGVAPTLSKTVNVAEVYAQGEAAVGTEVAVSSIVVDVCQKKGCWAVLEYEGKTMRVTIPDHDWALPKTIAGQTGVFQGKVVMGETSKKSVKHFEGESSKPEVIPEKQEGLVLALEISGASIEPKAAEEG